jgi:glycosyltransferase involved in cell wall biosynthesis
MSPKFSIALCTYNSIEYIDQCIDSLLQQTLQEFELIIVDDGSTDGTVEYLRGIPDGRVRLLILGENHGLIYARTQAFAAATADYIALMDADDIAHPRRLEEQFRVLEAGPVDICASRYQTLETGTHRLRTRTSYVRDADLKALMTIYCPICNPTASFKRKLLAVTGYQERFRHAEDYAFWTALAASGCVFQIVPRPLLTYRIHPQQVSRVQSAAARNSFLDAQRQYVRALLGSERTVQSMPLGARLKSGLQFMLDLNRKISRVSVSANYEIYGEFQYRRNGWRTPFLRLERLLMAVISSAAGRFSPR